MTLKNSDITVGILGLQGAFHKHQKMLERLSVNPIIIRYPEEIEKCQGIILPGGESTTMTKLLKSMALFEPLQKYNGPMFGTCAGAILLSTGCDDPRVDHLAKIPVQTSRNAFGRQIESFVAPIQIKDFDSDFQGVFIRAPQFEKIIGTIEVLGRLNQQPVFLKYGNVLVSSFHPELTDDIRIHQYFLNLIQ
ncbi:MAG: pyridoxal 5'-phosphate synthase glutaminase subunit PdxT [Candidatus Marinimicrobia bacterium]|nr:pyridoxal 5'-phosphate synthase glutaminase subunit PdxT [Candidatus Neomarinimicrobiota bacterium]